MFNTQLPQLPLESFLPPFLEGLRARLRIKRKDTGSNFVFDLDQTLRRLGDLPVPTGLAGIDDAVFVGLAQRRQEAMGATRMMSLAAALALLLGVAGGGLSGGDPASARPLSPFSPDNPLAPSTLLDVHP
ncbi:hypothetical protein [Novosphingobium cyanobacteriorum]|uniref:Uncharacterized protein n=1 Tax=Novosphingobium cyanobacteriorum TaxID=3024215 RepID=A0ABT6CPT6_9SPHN|nr:hypothetical protein [Novosphingobium cyanobacteriorum]MDF8335479.1 hypothetical protein [Novosphingobium cyanobacteriorum]